ncbi:hypothetical protein [Acinetobacter pollinis]|uniref:DUF2247 family protein n=1 Tax=Acinetobacter pollinis TaxID=2605270 RepID=A0ABU6DWV9_9GAMM|nr:hypothetical protein [Acinetobacter pollinis]MEB5477664.1 hypothetical protein [Acinetobacter pollinis]
MIDVSPQHIENLIESCWHPDVLEYYKDENEFYSLDFSNINHIEYAINKWLGVSKWRSLEEEKQYKEDLRYCITKKKWVLGNAFLNKIDNTLPNLRKPVIDNKYWNDWDNDEKNFFLLLLMLWEKWFNEPFSPADLSQYRERIDEEFVNFPHMPEFWNEAKYKD